MHLWSVACVIVRTRGFSHEPEGGEWDAVRICGWSDDDGAGWRGNYPFTENHGDKARGVVYHDKINCESLIKHGPCNSKLCKRTEKRLTMVGRSAASANGANAETKLSRGSEYINTNANSTATEIACVGGGWERDTLYNPRWKEGTVEQRQIDAKRNRKMRVLVK